MRCAECGTMIPPTARHGKPQKYCSSKCRLRAWRREQKNAPVSPKSPERPTKAKVAKRKQTVRVNVDVPSAPTVPAPVPEPEPYDVLLRRTQKRLQQAMFDAATPSTSLSALSKQLLAVTKELESLEEQATTAPNVIVSEVNVDDSFDAEAI